MGGEHPDSLDVKNLPRAVNQIAKLPDFRGGVRSVYRLCTVCVQVVPSGSGRFWKRLTMRAVVPIALVTAFISRQILDF